MVNFIHLLFIDLMRTCTIITLDSQPSFPLSLVALSTDSRTTSGCDFPHMTILLIVGTTGIAGTSDDVQFSVTKTFFTLRVHKFREAFLMMF